ncbi:hypothetical protein DFJ58DRAFT_770487 [Suillus subalutaceus]|uniref:uncharacterized protein n=1 Tax=Suillus subalutaceus TaxID=48586 RepID=UPI001B886105|nr:uncharacterized protein DFJ58DRAFT_770487 [Suillus subalutaceus]KAG1865837.1 hypothetical protein DFJ58DRAFT_770487 [Suillus subalutaceus]
MSYPYYQSTLNGWGSNQLQFGRPPPIQFQPQPSSHAPHIDPTIFNQVYGRMFNADVAPVGVGINEARVWHRRGYGGLCAISALSPQEIGYASAYEAYRFWIHNIALYEPFGAEIERQKEAFTGLAIAEAIKMYMISNPADTDYYIPACEAAAATALHIFDENSSGSSRGDIGAGMGYDTGMDDSERPGWTGSGMAGVIDPHAIDYDAPYLRQKTGRHRRLSMSAPHSAAGAYSPRARSVMGGIGSSPYLGTAPSMGMGANPTIYGGGSPLVGGNGMGITGTHGGVYPAYGAGSSVYGGASPVHAPPIYGASSPYTGTPKHHNGLPRRRHRSSSTHYNRRARSAEPGMIAYTDAMGGPTSNHAMAVGGLTRGAVGGFTRGAMGGASIGASSPMGGGVGGFYGGPNKGYGYPGHKSIYRY